MAKSQVAALENFDKRQPVGGILLIIVLFCLGLYLSTIKAILPLQLLSGILLGIVLTRARFGFAGGIKRIYVRGEGSLTKALLVMLAVTMLVFLGAQWFAAQNGAVPAFIAGDSDLIIPGTQNVHLANIATIIGGFIFGMGMIFSGGCASGTLTDMGEGEGRALIAFIFFVLGSAPGEWARYTVDQSALGKVGLQAYLPDYLGYLGAFALSLIGIGVIYWLTVKYEQKRKLTNSYANPLGDWEEFEKPLAEDNSGFWSFKTYHKFFIERLSFMTGGLLIAFICSFILLTTGKAWGVTSAFSKLAVAVLQPLGVSFDSPAFTKIVADVNGGLLSDGGTIRNLGIVAGAVIAFLLAGRFSWKFKISLKDGSYFALGGLMMGFGARLAKGCNAGALYSAMSTFSIAGWVFLVAMCFGGVACLKLFAGKMSMVPPARK